MGSHRSGIVNASEPDTHVRDVRRYYHTLESMLGYRFMVQGVKHFGWHDNPDRPTSIAEAQKHENDILAEHLNLKRGAEVLEGGCGEGSSANFLADHFGWHITGVDLLPRNIQRAKRQARRSGNGNTFMVADYMHLPFADNTFDGVYDLETFVHAPDANELFKELHRVLKPRGKLVFCEYSMAQRNRLDPEQQRLMTIMNTVGAMPALEQFTTHAFPGILKKAGFKNIAVEDATSHIMPTLKYFHDQARIPNKIIKALHLERHFVNAYCAAEVYEAFMHGDQFMYYYLVSADCNK